MEWLSEMIAWHHTFAHVVRIASVVFMVWMLLAYWRQQTLGRGFYQAIIVSEILIMLQFGLGVYFFLSLGLRPSNLVLHLLYGILTIITFPIVMQYTRNEPEQQRVILIWLFGFLFMFGLTFRTILTGS